MAVKVTGVTGPGVKKDPEYGDLLVAKFINCIMRDGKKTKAEKIFYSALREVEKKIKDKPVLEVFKTAVNNVKPIVEVKSRRVGGANYQVPVKVQPARQQSLAIRWIMEAVAKKKGKPTHVLLAAEICDAFNKEGAAMSTRENTHRMAEANKAFAHFAW
jgi:small subunit ribosomal protein S7